MKVSIIIPIYNSEMYLEECLDSVRRQTYKNIEVILVDDGSIDKSRELCRQICKKDKRFYYYYQENQGPSVARNKGLAMATGDFVTFVDSDDIYEDDAIEKMITKSIEKKADLAVFSIKTFNDSKERIILASNQTVYIDKSIYMANIAIKDEVYGGGFTFGKLWKTSSIKKNNEYIQYDTELFLYEDKLWILQNITRIKTIILCEDIVYKYRILENSLSHKIDEKRQKQHFIAAKKIEQVCRDVCEEKSKKLIYYNYLMQLMRYIYLDKASINKAYIAELKAGMCGIIVSKAYNWKSKMKYCYVVIMAHFWMKNRC